MFESCLVVACTGMTNLVELEEMKQKKKMMDEDEMPCEGCKDEMR